MKLVVVAVGKLRMAPIADLVGEYLKRCRRFAPVETIEVRAGRGRDPSTFSVVESERILGVVKQDDHVVVCDEKGGRFTTKSLASLVSKRMAAGGTGRLLFVVGGAGGVDERMRERADTLLSLSALTLPHEVARLVLVEQIYRVLSLLHGHPYHREG